MTDFAGFKGAAKRLDDIDLPKLGATIGVGEDEIHAFMDVEAAGSGFDSQKRPKMLFEPHVFYRNLTGAKCDRAVALGLAYPKWGTKPYPKDSYPRLASAMAIDESAALKSASWGLGQILGENYATVDYNSPQAMVLAFMADEENHLKAMVDFLIAHSIDDDLKAHRWEMVARVYNGPGKYVSYAKELAAAFAKWSKIRDTPWTAGEPVQPPPVATAPTTPAPSPLPLPVSPPAGSTAKVAAGGAIVAGGAVTTAAANSSLPLWVVVLIGLVVVGGLVWWFLLRKK